MADHTDICWSGTVEVLVAAAQCSYSDMQRINLSHGRPAQGFIVPFPTAISIADPEICLKQPQYLSNWNLRSLPRLKIYTLSLLGDCERDDGHMSAHVSHVDHTDVQQKCRDRASCISSFEEDVVGDGNLALVRTR